LEDAYSSYYAKFPDSIKPFVAFSMTGRGITEGFTGVSPDSGAASGSPVADPVEGGQPQ